MDISITRTKPQKKFMESDAKFRAFVSGVGAGKTSCGWMCVLEYAFQNPGSLGVIIAPTYALIRDVIIKERPNWIPDGLIKSFNKTDKELTFINGSIILFRSAKDDRQIEMLRGLSIAYAWVDEATLLPRLILEILTARLRQPGYEPKMWITCTPRKGWVYDLLKTDMPDEWFCLDNIPTYSNTFLTPGYVKSLKELYTGQFYNQEVMGEWVDFEGLIWIPYLSPAEPRNYESISYAIDVGYTHPSAITVVGLNAGHYYVIDEFHKSHTNDPALIFALSELQQKHGHGITYVDPSVPRVISEINKAGMPAMAADNNVIDGLRTVRALFDTGRLTINPRCINLLKEIESYVWADKDQEAPVKLNDDACDSLRYNIYSVTGSTMKANSGVVTTQ